MESETTMASRFADVRAQMGVTGGAFASALNGAARELGFEGRWTESKVSQSETGKRSLSLEDIAMVLRVDPAHRTWDWFAFGRKLPARKLVSTAPELPMEKPQRGYIPMRRAKGKNAG